MLSTKVPIESICKNICSGGTPKSTIAEYYDGDILWLNTKEIDFNRIYTTEKKITELGMQNSSAKWIFPNTIVVAMYGATAGKVAIVKQKMTTNQACCNLMIDEALADYRYVYYALSSRYSELASLANGGAQQNLSAQIIKNFEIPLPDLSIQKRIAAVLSSLDDKIELNAQINHNLEGQAKAIFKSWFVDFEPFGGIQPQEITETPLEKICSVITKGTTPTTLGKKFLEQGINFIKAESITDNHIFDEAKFSHIDDETNNLLRRSQIAEGDILFTIAGTLGRFGYVDGAIVPANTNQAVAILRVDQAKVPPFYVYSFFISNWHQEYYRKRVQQAVQANLSLGTIKTLPILLLPNNLMQIYNQQIEPLFATINKNVVISKKLTQLRDNLLPKLMSGEIDVSEVEI